ncbi:hypothetical protein RchiOBHm_Chr2g0146341 [Rosa chinensis]|uniref:Uncharacterized protein n=1 Tax=Rosa chinensis TaxID=74649 RepID=A0A2P6RYX3_ROSCH|nr:hypothetical protein RchiOBHm_Chr2g0146341 [Rosa chinensis]
MKFPFVIFHFMIVLLIVNPSLIEGNVCCWDPYTTIVDPLNSGFY